MPGNTDIKEQPYQISNLTPFSGIVFVKNAAPIVDSCRARQISAPQPYREARTGVRFQETLITLSSHSHGTPSLITVTETDHAWALKNNLCKATALKLAILPGSADGRTCRNAPEIDASHCMRAAGTAANWRVYKKGPCLIVKKLTLDETEHQR